jgi:phosphohistidine phosphatase
MKTLFLLRHAKSSWKDNLLEDHDRPLNRRGRDEAPLVGEYLRQRGLTPAFVAVSTARRAIQTAAEVLSVIRYDGLVCASRDLHLADSETLLSAIRKTPRRCPSLLLIAHNPGIEEIIEQLTGQASPMPTSSLAHIELPIETWRELAPDRAGTLVETWRPATRR